MSETSDHRRRRDLAPSLIGVVEARGDIAGAGGLRLDRLIADCLADDCRHIIVDLLRAGRCDAQVIHRLINHARALRLKDGRLVLARPRGVIRNFIESLGGAELVIIEAGSLLQATARFLGGLPVPGALDAGRLQLRRRPSPAPAVLLLEIRGYLGGREVPGFQFAFDRILARSHARVMLDCSELKGVVSTGLGGLVKYADQLEQRGGGLALINVPAKVMIVLKMLGLTPFFKISGSITQGLSQLGEPREDSQTPVFPDRHPPFLEGDEPLCPWEYFVRERPDGEREGVLINAALRGRAPIGHRPYLLALRHPFLTPDHPSLLVPLAERDHYAEFEQRLLPEFLARLGACLSSRRTDRRGVTWVFYGERAARGGLTLDQILARMPQRASSAWSRSELWDEEDPSWDQYFATLRAGISAERLAEV